jgi:hypothetical protein
MSSRYNLSREIVCWCMRLLCVTRIFRLKSAKRRRRRKESVRILFNRKKKTYVSVHNSIIFFLSMSPYRNRKRWTKNMLISQASRFFFLSLFYIEKNFDMWYVRQICHIINKKKQPFKIDKFSILSAKKKRWLLQMIFRSFLLFCS